MQFKDLTTFTNNLNSSFIQASFIPQYSNLFNEQLLVQPKLARFRKTRIYNPLIAKGKWSPRQQLAYIHFLQTHSELLQTSFQRKINKVFLTMSHVIQTRDANQCRSHHQKMIIYRSTIAEIIKYYRNDLSSVQNRQRRMLKKDQKVKGKTEDTKSCKDDIYQPYKVVSNGNHFKISIQSSKMQSYDF